MTQGLKYWMKYLLTLCTKYNLAPKRPRTKGNLGKGGQSKHK